MNQKTVLALIGANDQILYVRHSDVLDHHEASTVLPVPCTSSPAVRTSSSAARKGSLSILRRKVRLIRTATLPGSKLHECKHNMGVAYYVSQSQR